MKILTSPGADQIELRMSAEEAECVLLALDLLQDDLDQMPIYHPDEVIRRSADVIAHLIETLDRALDHAET